jgi:voltage-gated sodium channel type XI alpha
MLKLTAIVRLIFISKKFRSFLEVLLFSLPLLFNVIILLIFIYFIYAILGIYFFSNINTGVVINKTFNF